MNQLERTKQWFEIAIPEPTKKQACIQVGCHLEEVDEMLMSLGFYGEYVEDISHDMKKAIDFTVSVIRDVNEIELLDSLADQIVTAIGVAHMMGFDILGALQEVNRSNFSKFEDGKAVFDENGKIRKGKDYTPPNLESFV